MKQYHYKWHPVIGVFVIFWPVACTFLVSWKVGLAWLAVAIAGARKDELRS